MHAQAASKIDYTAYAREVTCAKGQCCQAAIRLPCDEDAILINPRLGMQIFQCTLQIIGLDLAMRRHIAAWIYIVATRLGKAFAHGNRYRIPAPHEFTT